MIIVLQCYHDAALTQVEAGGKIKLSQPDSRFLAGDSNMVLFLSPPLVNTQLIRDCNNNVQRMRRTEELIYLSQKIEFECKVS